MGRERVEADSYLGSLELNILCQGNLCYIFDIKQAGCFSIIVLQMYCNYKCTVALPHVALGWSAVCGFGIS